MVHLLLAVIYLSFISLGLPDSLLGAAWPTVYIEFGVPFSYAGIISAIIAIGTVVSSLMSDRITRRLGAGVVTGISVAMTAAALFGFSVSRSFAMLCLWSVPYGLGAGSVDASLNNYVALHYASRHMSWLHCMWGIGASVGPYIMSFALSGGQGWSAGYRYIAVMQIFLTVILLLSLPLWKKRSAPDSEHAAVSEHALTIREIIRIPGVRNIMAAFFCYAAVEQTTALWASSYLVLHRNLSPETAAGFSGLFFIGITAGRALSGFLTIKFSDSRMIFLGQATAAAGVVFLLLPFGEYSALIGLMLIGLGCAPIYPCIIHSTPSHFGADKSHAVIGVQMASAYLGTTLMPPLFGFIAKLIGVAVLPAFLLIALLLMFIMYLMLTKKSLRRSC